VQQRRAGRFGLLRQQVTASTDAVRQVHVARLHERTVNATLALAHANIVCAQRKGNQRRREAP
jgi:hypothetical protein